MESICAILPHGRGRAGDNVVVIADVEDMYTHGAQFPQQRIAAYVPTEALWRVAKAMARSIMKTLQSGTFDDSLRFCDIVSRGILAQDGGCYTVCRLKGGFSGFPDLIRIVRRLRPAILRGKYA